VRQDGVVEPENNQNSCTSEIRTKQSTICMRAVDVDVLWYTWRSTQTVTSAKVLLCSKGEPHREAQQSSRLEASRRADSRELQCTRQASTPSAAACRGRCGGPRCLVHAATASAKPAEAAGGDRTSTAHAALTRSSCVKLSLEAIWASARLYLLQESAPPPLSRSASNNVRMRSSADRAL